MSELRGIIDPTHYEQNMLVVNRYCRECGFNEKYKQNLLEQIGNEKMDNEELKIERSVLFSIPYAFLVFNEAA